MTRIADQLEQCRRAAMSVLHADADDRRVTDAALYLAHVVLGVSMRGLAAQQDCQPSTIMRAVRRVEQRRDDPLADALLEDASAWLRAHASAHDSSMETALTHSRPSRPAVGAPGDKEIVREAKRILRRLCEPGAFLALARGAETACVFRKGKDGLVTLARLSVAYAKAFAAREWIVATTSSPNMACYEISAVGRAWLKRVIAEEGERRRRGAEAREMAEAASPFARQHAVEGERLFPENGESVRRRVNLGETPLGWLAKRKGPDGKPFLTSAEVAAGEKLREDFELAQLGPRVAQDWTRLLAPVDEGGVSRLRGPSEGPMGARERLARALEALGPGLNDVALRACCFLEGLEATERRMGWSARSGKVVLKIALTRLAEHYGYAGAEKGRKLRKAV
ncbi:DUF6456 domain-containing protein [Oceanicella actignis]|uniref:DUF6456 domain-containing protein n=1 Tax=Oceanicella actignis TaxID=1189325 RepID=UPI0012558A0B|nr:DUF6456 domain-containing protein [Oceanicella actignis]TYO89597.1 hypothetical protein LY05_01586 [Oceanicella actignis]